MTAKGESPFRQAELLTEEFVENRRFRVDNDEGEASDTCQNT